MSIDGKNKLGRPTKLTEEFIKAADKVINHSMNIIILTDEELFIEINSQLEPQYKISYTTFKNIKSRGKKLLEDNIEEYTEGKTDEEIQEINKVREIYEHFLSLYKKALINQKQSLFKKFEDTPIWQKYAWIIERKFEEWNLKVKTENDNTNKNVEIDSKLLLEKINNSTKEDLDIIVYDLLNDKN